MARGRRCVCGCESWPPGDDYKRCPACGEPTKVYRNLNVLDADEAASKKAHFDFEHFYGDHCAERGFQTHGPVPTEVTGPVPEDLCSKQPRSTL